MYDLRKPQNLSWTDFLLDFRLTTPGLYAYSIADYPCYLMLVPLDKYACLVMLQTLPWLIASPTSALKSLDNA